MNRLFKRITLLGVILFFLSGVLSAQQPGDVTGISVADNILTLYSGNDVITVSVYSDNIIRVNYLPNGVEDENTLVISNFNLIPTSVSIDTSGNSILVTGSKMQLEINKSPIRFALYNAQGTLVANEPVSGGITKASLRFEVPTGNYYGVSNSTSSLLNNSGGNISAGSQGGAGAPFIWSTNGVGLLVDSDGGNLNLTGGVLSFNRQNGNTKNDIEFFFILGTPKEIMMSLTDVTGKSPLFPKFSYGFLNTEWGMTEQELRSDINTYREKGIPLDGYVLDFDWMDWGNAYGEFSWGPDFPGGPTYSLKEFLDTTHTHLFAIRKPRVHVNTPLGNFANSNGYFIDQTTDYWSGQTVGRLDFHQEEVRQWYWDNFIQYADGYNTGITGYWNDEADEYGGNFMFMQMQRGNYEGQRGYNNNRVWSINRNFYLGAQRYGYAHWSGDIHTGFGNMADQRTFMLSSIALGSAWWGMDIGGFNGTPGYENYYRWMQFGAFVPVYRVHGTHNEEREPWNYGTEAEAIAKKYISLRYELLPYIYSGAWENHLTGLPFVRPMIMEFPNDEMCKNMISQWMFGNDIMVRPVVESGAQEVSVYIPQGEWVDFHNGDIYYGPTSVNYPVTHEDIPIFVKAGAVITKMAVKDYVDNPEITGVVYLDCYPGNNGTAKLYDDDGITFNYENGAYAVTEYTHSSQSDFAQLNISAMQGNYTAPERDYVARFLFTETKPDSVLVDDELFAETTADSLLNNSVLGWAFNNENKTCYVRVDDAGFAQSIKVFFMEDNEAPTVDSLYITTSNKLMVYFSENVVMNDEEYSALNSANYSITGGAEVISARRYFNNRTVELTTSEHQPEVEYNITISGISDASSNNNIMEPVSFSYNYVPVNEVVLVNGVDGYQGCMDAHIMENFVNNNTGGHNRFEVCRYEGGSANDDKSALIRFDTRRLVGNIDNIIDARIVLTLSGTRNGSVPKNVMSFRLKKEWYEGDRAAGIDGDVATNGEVTWTSAKRNESNWSNAGGDFVSVASDTTLVGDFLDSEYSWDVTQYVKEWVQNPEANFGVILREIQSNSSNGTKVFYSTEEEDINKRPKLVVRSYDSLATGIKNEVTNLPESYVLAQNYPNPFNPTTTISYAIPAVGKVTLKVYDILGQEVVTLVNEIKQPGSYVTKWNGNNSSGNKVTSGVYLYRIECNDFVKSNKMILLK